jgi:Zn-dependent peptidase ImmA (M78 family)
MEGLERFMNKNCLPGNADTGQIMPISLNMEESTSLIVERARQFVNQLIEQRGHGRPPFLSAEYARLLGIKRIEKADLGEVSAILIKLHSGDVIRLNQNHNLARQNFSCAHEIGHVLLSELKIEPLIEEVAFRTFNPQDHQIARVKARERLCDAAATELLMPEAVFKQYLSNFGISIKSLEWLANIFRVSISSTAIRIAEVSTEACIALLWRPRQGTKTKTLQLAWQVGPSNKSQIKGKYVPKHNLARYASTLYKAYQHNSPIKCRKDFIFDAGIKRIPIESKGFGYDKARYVISLAFPTR